MTSFNLIDEGWISVRMLDGGGEELSLRDVFHRADDIAGIDGDLPVQDFAIFRLLLAVLYGAVPEGRTVRDWSKLWQSGLPLSAIDEHLEKYRDRFDLLHSVTPFMQVAGLQTPRDEVFSFERLILDLPAGEPFFTVRGGPALGRLGLGEAARWLVAAQAYDPSGIKSGVVGDPRVKGGRSYPAGPGWAGQIGGIVVEGASLARTLLLNFELSDEWPGDTPSWTRPAPGPDVDPGAQVTGPAALYSWGSRRIRLAHDGSAATGVVLTYGDRVTPQNRERVEPMTAWRRSPAQQAKLKLPQVFMPRTHDPERQFWRGIGFYVPQASTAHASGVEVTSIPPRTLRWLARLREYGLVESAGVVRLRAYGLQYGTQEATVAEQIADVLEIDLGVLTGAEPRIVALLEDAVTLADEVVRTLGHLSSNIARAEGRSDESATRETRSRAYAAVDHVYRRWLMNLRAETAPDAARQSWHDHVERIAVDEMRRAVSRAGTAAIVGREVNGTLMNAAIAHSRANRRIKESLAPWDCSQSATAEKEMESTA